MTDKRLSPLDPFTDNKDKLGWNITHTKEEIYKIMFLIKTTDYEIHQYSYDDVKKQINYEIYSPKSKKSMDQKFFNQLIEKAFAEEGWKVSAEFVLDRIIHKKNTSVHE